MAVFAYFLIQTLLWSCSVLYFYSLSTWDGLAQYLHQWAAAVTIKLLHIVLYLTYEEIVVLLPEIQMSSFPASQPPFLSLPFLPPPSILLSSWDYSLPSYDCMYEIDGAKSCEPLSLSTQLFYLCCIKITIYEK